MFLEQFKCFGTLNLPLAPLTLLSGWNSSGKSSILQSMAILHQTSIESEWTKSLILNSSTVSLGTVGDVVNKITGRKEFKIGLSSDTFECIWTMGVDDRTSLSAPIRKVSYKENNDWKEMLIDDKDQNTVLRNLIPAKVFDTSENAKNFASIVIKLTYISANRIGPEETYDISTSEENRNVGAYGERTAWFLHHFEDYEPLSELIVPDFPPKLQRQTEAWMKKFFPGTSLIIEPVRGANLVTMGIRSNDSTDFHRPQNIGYGVTHALPLIVACLGASQGALILVENPEGHLHPSGQADMGGFFAKCVAAGLQVIIETHSDHFLNGIRRAVKSDLIKPEDVAIHFFAQQEGEEEEIVRVTSPSINNNGDLSEWPKGFFDQYDKDLAFLIGWED